MPRFEPPKHWLLLLIFFYSVSTQAQQRSLLPAQTAEIQGVMRKVQTVPTRSLQPQRPTTASQRTVSGPGTANKMYPWPGASRTQGSTCVDSSFLKVFEAADRAHSFFCSARTADGGILIGGYGRSKLEGPPYYFYAVITKFDSLGNHIWSKELHSDVYAALAIESMTEMSDGSIIVSGTHENSLYYVPFNDYSDYFIAKLTPIGDEIWFKTFHTLLTNNCSSTNIRYSSFAEGTNGDLYVTATIVNCPLPKYLLVFKLDKNGNVQWQYSFRDTYNDSYAIGVFYEGNQLTVINRGFDGGDVIHVDLLHLNSATGSLLFQKGWQIDGLVFPATLYHGFANWILAATKLDNGNYCVFGQTIGDVGNQADFPRFSVLEFNGTHDFVSGYTINSSVNSNYSVSNIKVDRSGRVFYSLYGIYPSYLDHDRYIALANNGHIINQRRKEFRNLESFWDNGELFGDGSLIFLANLASPGQDNFYLDYFKLHPSDTGSVCLGERSDFSYTVPITYVPYDFNWAEINPNAMVPTNNQGNSTVPLVYTASPPCFQNTFCDTIKLHGNPSSCTIGQALRFSVFKNKECGIDIQWSTSIPVKGQLQRINDTTLSVRFDKEWQGWLYAGIDASCGLLRDSLFVTIHASPGNVDLGHDTTICPSNHIELNARRGYASYLWSDGSVDSILTVTTPGTYYVDVKDACGTAFNDTMHVTAAPPIPFDIGADRFKCNDDTLHLAAPAGFLDYTWGPAYNINTLSGDLVIVRPAKDTIYYVRAEKSLGCFAYDTLSITVSQSPPVFLGKDTNFCKGDSIILAVVAGFSGYHWSTGSLAQQLSIHVAGDYSVIATTALGCSSYDTLRVLNVWPLPTPTLDHTTSLCLNSNRELRPGNYLSYSWQDGSTGPTLTVTGPGTFYVSVIDGHSCVGSDTARITTILPLPTNFLPADTAICNYGNLIIKPSSAYRTYAWNIGTQGPSITVTAPGDYWLQVTDQDNCTGRDSIKVFPRDCLNGFYMPTAFTPNNDGRNDWLRPFIGGNVTQYQLTIYNRWGQVVFTTKDINKGWDGTFHGLPQDTHVFAWYCVYQLEGGEVRKEKGTSVLIR